jgi:hypothetical protein
LVAVRADQQAQRALPLAARAVALSHLLAAAAGVVVLLQLTPPKLAALAVLLAARLRARVAALLLLRLTPARRPLRVLP